jgi:RIP metalloprotease RseP
MGINIVSVVILLGVLIFAHELGHFLMAKRSGVGVLKFSLGFGPKVIGKKIGETEYLLSLIPLGGYVKLLGEAAGEELSAEDEKRSFLKQTVLKRIGIVAAGPVFNVLLALLIFTIVNMIGLPVLTSEIGGLQPDSAAQGAGLKAGDTILNLDGIAVKKWDEISEIISQSKGRSLRITLRRSDRDPPDHEKHKCLWRGGRSVQDRHQPLAPYGHREAQPLLSLRSRTPANMDDQQTYRHQHCQNVSRSRFTEDPGWPDPDCPDSRRSGSGRDRSLHLVYGSAEH